MSLVDGVANGVVAILQGLPALAGVTVEYRVLPEYGLEDLQDGVTRVLVIPREREDTLTSRHSTKHVIGVDIGIQHRFPRNSEEPESLGIPTAQIAPLLSLTEAVINGILGSHTVAPHPSGVCLQARNEPIYAREALLETHTYFSVIRCGYTLLR